MKKLVISLSILTFFLFVIPLTFSFFSLPETGRFLKEKIEIPKESISHDVFLHLKIGKFDPLKKEVKIKDFHIESLPEDEENYYIIQLKGPIKEEWKNKLKELGLKIIDYIPDYAYIVKMKGSFKNQLKGLDFIRWIGIYQPSYKIDPRILEKDFGIKLKKEKNKEINDTILVRILLFGSEDLPTVLKTIEKLGGKIVSKGNDFIIANLKKSDINSIAFIPSVKWIEEYKSPQLFLDVSTKIISAPAVWNVGLNGSGVNISVTDTGIDSGNLTTLHPDLRGRVVALIDYTENNTYDGIAEDPHGHGTHTAGTVLGNGTASNRNYTGVASAANLIVQRVFDDYGWYSGPSDLRELFNDSFKLKAKVTSNSWGSNTLGIYTIDDADVDEAVRKYNLTIVFAAGNSGPGSSTTGSPGNAKNVITVGATENNKPYVNSSYPGYSDNPNEVAFFSSRGPTEDGRVKPDVVAPGTAILAPKSSLAPSSRYERYGGVVQGNGGDYGYMAGTSMATPHVAGLSALVIQKYFETFGKYPSPALVKAMIINGADDIGYGYPSCIQGWGRVNANKTLLETPTRKIIPKEENVSLATENYSAYKLKVGNASAFKVTLVWTDVPGSPSASKALVNDLDLIVVSQKFSYRGNDFTYPFDDYRDDVNNVENVFIENPESGNYTVIVYASNIPNETQRYALVISGNVSELQLTPDEDIFPPTITNITPGNSKTSFGALLKINATVRDDKGISKVWINYTKNGTVWEIKFMDKMYSDIYSANITIDQNGTWSYRIIANDTSSKISSSKLFKLWTSDPIKVFVVDSFGTDFPSYMPWDELNNNWLDYGDKPIIINYTFLNKENISYQDLVSSGAEVLVISCSGCTFSGEFTDSEIDAIKKYTKEGHGLIATAGTLYYQIPNNNKLAPLFGMREDLNYFAGEFEHIKIIDLSHPLFSGFSSVIYYPGYPITVNPEDYAWNDTDLEGGTYVALSDNNASAIIVYRNITYITHIPEYYSTREDKQLLYNALTWSRFVTYDHDIEVESLIILPTFARPGATITINATVANYGKYNESDVEVKLLVNGSIVDTKVIPNLQKMSGVSLSFNYSNQSSGVYNISVYALPVPNENFTQNNIKSIYYTISDAKILLVDDDEGKNYEIYYENALKANNYSYVKLNTLFNNISSEILSDFPIVVWSTGDDPFNTISSTDQIALKNFLDSGGSLFISGQDIGFDIGYSSFYKEYLHAFYVEDDADTDMLYGIEKDPIGDELILKISGGDGANNQIWPDVILPYDSYASIVFNYSSNDTGAIKADTGVYRVVYFAFGFEGINNSQTRNEVMKRVISWLTPKFGIYNVKLNPPIPDNTTEVTISAQILGNSSAITKVSLFWTNSSTWYEIPMVFVTPTKIQTSFPIPKHPTGTVISYFINASDLQGNVTQTPIMNYTVVRKNYPPYSFDASVNATFAGKPTLFSLRWKDDLNLSGYVFSWSNESFKSSFDSFNGFVGGEINIPCYPSNSYCLDAQNGWKGYSEDLYSFYSGNPSYSWSMKVDNINGQPAPSLNMSTRPSPAVGALWAYKSFKVVPNILFNLTFYARCISPYSYDYLYVYLFDGNVTPCTSYRDTGACQNQNGNTSRSMYYTTILCYQNYSIWSSRKLTNLKSTSDTITLGFVLYDFMDGLEAEIDSVNLSSAFTEIWLNDSWTNKGWDSNLEWSNVTKVLPSEAGLTIKWKVYANDSDNGWNVSQTFSFVTTSSVCDFDGVCDSGETCSNCIDCPCPGSTGCCGDSCGCPEGQVCQNDVCVSPSPSSSIPNCYDYKTKEACLAADCYWCDNVCQLSPCPIIYSLEISEMPSLIEVNKTIAKTTCFNLKNTGNVAINNISINIFGLVQSWYSVNPSFIDKLDSLSNLTICVTFNVSEKTGEGDYPIRVEASNHVKASATTILRVYKRLTCPKCPEPSEWGECKNGIRKRIVYYCNSTSDFICQSFEEIEGCSTLVIDLRVIGVIALIAVMVGVLAYLFLPIFTKPQVAI